MGFFDDLFGQPFGGMLDFNRDGKTDFAESWLGYKIIEDCMKKEKEDDPYSDASFMSTLDDDTDDANGNWQLFADEGDEYGIDPYDFDSEAEYREAVEDAALAKKRKPTKLGELSLMMVLITVTFLLMITIQRRSTLRLWRMLNFQNRQTITAIRILLLCRLTLHLLWITPEKMSLKQ